MFFQFEEFGLLLGHFGSFFEDFYPLTFEKNLPITRTFYHMNFLDAEEKSYMKMKKFQVFF